MTDYLDIFEFSSKAAYALYLKNGNEDGTTCSGYFNSSLAQGRVERDNSLFQDFFCWGWLRHSKMLLRIPWGSHLLSKQSAPAFCSSWIWHRFHHDEGCVTEDGPLRAIITKSR